MLLRLHFVFLLHSTPLWAQTPETWVMSHTSSMQPLFEAYYEGGELMYNESDPIDSTVMHNPGLMILRLLSDSTAVSYSLGQQEDWRFNRNGQSLVLYGQRDTLQGTFSNERLQLTSTLDDGQAQYTFVPLDMSPIALTELSDTRWRAQVPGHPMDGAAVRFELEAPFLIPTEGDTVHAAEVYHVQMGPYFITDYTLSQLSPQEFGIIYWYKQSAKQLAGLFFPLQQEDNKAPTAQQILLRLGQ